MITASTKHEPTPLDESITSALLEAKGNKNKAADMLFRLCQNDPALLARIALPVMSAIIQAHLSLSMSSAPKKPARPKQLADAQMSALSNKLGDLIGKTGKIKQGLASILQPEEPPKASKNHVAALKQMIQSYKSK